MYRVFLGGADRPWLAANTGFSLATWFDYIYLCWQDPLAVECSWNTGHLKRNYH